MKTPMIVRIALVTAVTAAMISGLLVLYAKTSSVDAEKKTVTVSGKPLGFETGKLA